MNLFKLGIDLILSRWSALQIAVKNEWGGHNSHLKAQQLADDVFSWFIQSKKPLYIDDLENLLDESMLSFSLVIEDGSVEQVAEELMILHEKCFGGEP